MSFKHAKDLKTSILIVTYDKDLEFLKYSLKSISKFCRLYNEVVVVIDDHENDCVETKKYLESIGQKYFINKEAKHITRGYIRQQYIKLYSEKYFDEKTDFVCHLDSDNIFNELNSPDVFFKGCKPVIGMQKWAEMPNNNFEESTNKTVGFDVDYNFMRRMPLVYPRCIFKELREFIISSHGDITTFLNSMKKFSEYNVIGAYCYKFHKDSFYWVDVVEDEKEWNKFAVPCVQYSNREKSQPYRYVDISKKGNAIEQIFKKC